MSTTDKIYLGTLRYVEKLKEILPVLIYFICFKYNPTTYRIDSRIIDVEQDCDALQKYNITILKPRKYRKSHEVTIKDCIFTPYGKKIAEEIHLEGLCEEISHRVDFNDKEAFNSSFYENFEFTIDPTETIAELIYEIQQKHGISLPQQNSHLGKTGIQIRFMYRLDGKRLLLSIELRCSCNHVTVTELTCEDLINHYKNDNFHLIRCDSNSCDLEFNISPDFYYFRYYENVE